MGQWAKMIRGRLADWVFLLSLLVFLVSFPAWLASTGSFFSDSEVALLEETSRAVARGEPSAFEHGGWRHRVQRPADGAGVIYSRLQGAAQAALLFLACVSLVTATLMKRVTDSSALHRYEIALSLLGYALVLGVCLMSQDRVVVRLAADRGVRVETRRLIQGLTSASPSPKPLGRLRDLRVSSFDDEFRLDLHAAGGQVRLLSHMNSPEALGRLCAELATVWETTCER